MPCLPSISFKIYADRVGKESLKLSQAATQYLLQYPYPGNIRELQNIIERSVIFADSDMIKPEDLPEYVTGPTQGETGEKLLPFKLGKERVISEFEQKHIRSALRATKGNISKAAELSGLDMKTSAPKWPSTKSKPASLSKPASDYVHHERCVRAVTPNPLPSCNLAASSSPARCQMLPC